MISINLMIQSIYQKKPYILDNKIIFLFDSYKEYDVFMTSNKIQITFLSNSEIYEIDRKIVSQIKFLDLPIIELSKETIIPKDDIIEVTGSKVCLNPQDLLKNDLNFYNRNAIAQIESKGQNVERVSEGDLECFKLSSDNSKWYKINYRVYSQSKAGRILSPYKGTIYFRTPELPQDKGFFSQYYLDDLRVAPTWKYYSGRNIKVAVVDDNLYWVGDLGDNVKAAENSAVVEKKMLHSLAVGGVIGAQRNNDSLIGIAYNAELYFHDFINIQKDERFAISDSISSVFAEYDIINNSWGVAEGQYNDKNNLFVDNLNQIISEYFHDAIENGRNGLGTIVIFAAGNFRIKEIDSNLGVADYGMILVGGTLSQDMQKYEKVSHPFPSIGGNILVAAPADNIPVLSTKNCVLPLGKSIECENSIEVTDGTSFSAPMISAVAALMLEANANLGWRDVHEIFSITAERVNDNSEYSYNKASNWNSKDIGMHYYREYGFGIVNTNAAVKLAESWNLKQISANQVVVESPIISFIEFELTGRYIQEVVIDYNTQIELVSLNINLRHFFQEGTSIYLQSPADTASLLFNGKLCSEETKENILLFKHLESVKFRGENSIGVWRIIFLKGESCKNKTINASSDDFLNKIFLTIYGKEEKAPKIHYFTDELSYYNNTELLVASDIDGINSAASNHALSLDLRPNMISNIGGKKIKFEGESPYFNSIITGDANDEIFINQNGTKITVGRGDNKIYLYNNTHITLYFPNLNVHTGKTSIYAHSPQEQVDLQFGQGAICTKNTIMTSGYLNKTVIDLALLEVSEMCHEDPMVSITTLGCEERFSIDLIEDYRL